jgi:fatty-acyl-CoA synthase
VLKQDYHGKVGPEELKAFFMQSVEDGRMPKFAVPEKILLVDAIAKTSVGKINKRALRKDFS